MHLLHIVKVFLTQKLGVPLLLVSGRICPNALWQFSSLSQEFPQSIFHVHGAGVGEDTCTYLFIFIDSNMPNLFKLYWLSCGLWECVEFSEAMFKLQQTEKFIFK